MSDNWIVLIPTDPVFVPSDEAIAAAERYFDELAPDAVEIEASKSTTIRFFDCGSNLERVRCPDCKAELPTDWWRETMERDFEDGFELRSYELPCCDAQHQLNELQYEWPQAFGKFAIEAMNPNIGQIPETALNQLQQILGTPLTVVYQHI